MDIELKHDVFNAIADPTRRELLAILANGDDNVSGLSTHFPISRPAVSKHLRLLREVDLVREVKVGRETRYQLNPYPLREVSQWLEYYDKFWGRKLENLKQLFSPKN